MFRPYLLVIRSVSLFRLCRRTAAEPSSGWLESDMISAGVRKGETEMRFGGQWSEDYGGVKQVDGEQALEGRFGGPELEKEVLKAASRKNRM